MIQNFVPDFVTYDERMREPSLTARSFAALSTAAENRANLAVKDLTSRRLPLVPPEPKLHYDPGSGSFFRAPWMCITEPMIDSPELDVHRSFFCIECLRAVVICVSCYRGQRYCGAECRRSARRRLVRQAGRKYSSTERGRQRAAERQRQRRLREQGPVTHHSRSAEEARRRAGPRSATAVTTPRESPRPSLCAVCNKHVGKFRLQDRDWPGLARRSIQRYRRHLARMSLREAKAPRA